MRPIPGFLCLLLFLLTGTRALAHPVPKNAHDRTITVRLQEGKDASVLRVVVDYRLEVDEETVLLRDMHPFRDEVNFLEYFPKRPAEYYAQFARIYEEIYAGNLIATANRQPLPKFRCLSKKQRLRDDDGQLLGHLRCDFVFETELAKPVAEKVQFMFREQNYFLEAGQISLHFSNETGLAVEGLLVPDDAFRKRAAERPEPNDDNRLREMSLLLLPGIRNGAPTDIQKTSVPPTDLASAPSAVRQSSHDDHSLVRLLMGDHGLWLTLVLAFVFGAAHALTPGHGKTLVAAYLVGERGTIWHALFLGLTTTLTHTGVVLVLAFIMAVLPERMQQSFQVLIENGLGLVLGLTVVGMGFWLLLQRLAGRADHVHVGGGHHHHHGSDSGSARVAGSGLSWGGLLVLGITGGIVPCWDAIVLLFYAVGTSRFWLVLPAVLAFSAGLAVVLVLIGILVVQVPRFVEARYGSGKLLRALPIVSAILVTLMGLWLCYDVVHGR